MKKIILYNFLNFWIIIAKVLTDVCQINNYDRCNVIYYILVLVADVIAKDVMAYCHVTDVIVTLVKVADVNHLILEVIDCILTDGSHI